MDSAEWDERYSAKEYMWATEPNQFVEAHLSDLDAGTAIDLGAGEGRNAVWLASRGWSVTAVDFSEAGLEKGRRLAEDQDVTVDFVRADATTYAPDGPVDLVVLSYLQLDSPGRQAVLDHARTWLNPGGTIFLIAHDASNVTDGYGGPPSADTCYTVDEITAAWSDLEISTAMVADRVVDTPDGTRTALDTLAIAKRI